MKKPALSVAVSTLLWLAGLSLPFVLVGMFVKEKLIVWAVAALLIAVGVGAWYQRRRKAGE